MLREALVGVSAAQYDLTFGECLLEPFSICFRLVLRESKWAR